MAQVGVLALVLGVAAAAVAPNTINILIGLFDPISLFIYQKNQQTMKLIFLLSYRLPSILSIIVAAVTLIKDVKAAAIYPLQPDGFVGISMNSDGSYQIACTGDQWFYWTSTTNIWAVGTPTKLTGMNGVGISKDQSPVSVLFSGTDGFRYFESVVPGDINTSQPTSSGIANTNSLSLSGSLAAQQVTQIMGTLDDAVWTSFESSQQFIKVLRVGTVVGSKIKPIGIVGCSNVSGTTKYRALDISSSTMYSSSDGQIFTKKASNLSWTSVNSPVLTSLSLAQDGSNLIIVTSSAGIRYSTNDGNIWLSFGSVVDNSPVQDCAISTDRSKIVVISGYDIYYSTNYGFTFYQIYPNSTAPKGLPETPLRAAINDAGDMITVVSQLSIYQGVLSGSVWSWSSVSIESTPATYVAII